MIRLNMPTLRKKMKILVDDPEGLEYLQRNSLVNVIFNEFTLRAGVIVARLKELNRLEANFPQIVEQQLKEKITPLLEENRTLKEQLQEKSKPTQKYESEIDILNKEKKTLTKSNTDLTSKIETLEENIQALQNEKKDLEGSIDKLNKTNTDEEEIDQIYDRLGTFKKIRNKLRIIELWGGTPQKVLRQIEILHLLEGQMGVGSIKQYIKEMIRGKLLSRTSIQGSYVLNISGYCDFELDCDKLCEKLLGSVYETGVQIRMEKNKSKREPDY